MIEDSLDGLLVIDKPRGLTSREAVNRVQALLPRRTRIGHSGTLDPLATGVLVLCIGSATRLTEYIQRMAKTYQAGIRLGARSDTDDADGQIEPVAHAPVPDREALDKALAGVTGIIEQTPPAFSAAHVAGRRAYTLARRGLTVELGTRPVRIDRITLLSYTYPKLQIEVHCGKGTYIRSLARDLGNALGCGAYVAALRRTAVGPFTTQMAHDMNLDASSIRANLLPVAAAVTELPRLIADETMARRLRQGQAVTIAEDGEPGAAEWAIFDCQDRLIAIAVGSPQSGLRPAKVFNGQADGRPC